MDTTKTLEGFAKIEEGMALLQHGPTSHAIRTLVAAYDLLMNRFAPFKVGDRVTLVRTPGFINKPDWQSYAPFLVAGAVGTVRHAECWPDGRLVFDVAFDDETYYSTLEGRNLPVSPERRRAFSFSEAFLRPLVTHAAAWTDPDHKD